MSSSGRGQSFLEVALILPVLILLLLGLTEVGFAINEYIDVIDATRVAARYGTNLTYTSIYTFDEPTDDGTPKWSPAAPLDKGVCTPQTTHFYYVVGCLAIDNLKRVNGLDFKVDQNPATDDQDDVVISVFSLDGLNVAARQPVGDSDGWSYSMANVGADPASDNGPGCRVLDINNDGTVDALDYCPSVFTNADVANKLSAVTGTAANSGLVVVEVFYHHWQVLNLPFFNLIPNPLRVHAYSFFPNPSAEPSATP